MRTERLEIRPIDKADVEKIVGLWADPKVTEFMGGPKDPEMIREYSMELATDPEAVFKEEGDRWWSVCLKDSGQWLGKVALLSKEVQETAEIELCYFLLPDAWGQGYASEAATALAEHALSELALESIISLIEPENERSVHVAKRVGMALDQTITRPGGAIRQVYRLRRKEC